MTVYDLNRDQLEELKQHYMTEAMEEKGETPSYDELARADEMYSDDFICKVYAGYEFTNDDFFCTAGQEEERECWAFTLLDNPIYGSREDIARVLLAIAEDIRNGGVKGRVHAITWKMERDNW